MASVSQMTEKMWPFILIGPITVSVNGVVTCTSTKGLRLKQIVTFDKPGIGPKDFEIKRVISTTDFLVGDPSKSIGVISQPTEYNGGLAAINEQERNTIGDGYVIRNVYESDPVLALRTILVDEFGNFYNTQNPLAIQLSDGSINIETVNANLAVFLTHLDNFPVVGDVFDSIRIGDGVDLLAIEPNGSINVNVLANVTGDTKNLFNVIYIVPSSSLTTIISYTVPPATTADLFRIEVTGTNIATYSFYVDSVLQGVRRTWFGGNISERFEFLPAISYPAGTLIKVKVEHNRPFAAQFEARIQLAERS